MVNRETTERGDRIDERSAREDDERNRAPDTGEARERILLEARALFAAQGFDATSVRQIADRVGVTVPALYYHFGSKDGILRALVEAHLALKERVVQDAGSAEDAPVERLLQGLRSYLEFIVDERSTTWIVLRDPRLLADEGLFEMVRASDERIAAVLSDCLEAGMRSGVFRAGEPLLTAHLLLAAARGAVLSRTIVGLGYDRGELLEATLDLLLRGLFSLRQARE